MIQVFLLLRTGLSATVASCSEALSSSETRSRQIISRWQFQVRYSSNRRLHSLIFGLRPSVTLVFPSVTAKQKLLEFCFKFFLNLFLHFYEIYLKLHLHKMLLK